MISCAIELALKLSRFGAGGRGTLDYFPKRVILCDTDKTTRVVGWRQPTPILACNDRVSRAACMDDGYHGFSRGCLALVKKECILFEGLEECSTKVEV